MRTIVIYYNRNPADGGEMMNTRYREGAFGMPYIIPQAMAISFRLGLRHISWLKILTRASYLESRISRPCSPLNEAWLHDTVHRIQAEMGTTIATRFLLNVEALQSIK